MRERRNDLEIRNEIPQIALQIPNSDRSPLYDVRYHARRYSSEQRVRSDVSRTIVEAFSNFDIIWWSQTGSNRRPHACKARALPAELWPRNQKTNAPHSIKVVGLGRLELPTSRLSSARSNQLSYKPQTLLLKEGSGTRSRAIGSRRATHSAKPSHSAKPLARVRPRRKRNEDGEIPPMQLNDPDDRWPLMFLKRFDRS